MPQVADRKTQSPIEIFLSVSTFTDFPLVIDPVERTPYSSQENRSGLRVSRLHYQWRGGRFAHRFNATAYRNGQDRRLGLSPILRAASLAGTTSSSASIEGSRHPLRNIRLRPLFVASILKPVESACCVLSKYSKINLNGLRRRRLIRLSWTPVSMFPRFRIELRTPRL